MTLLIGKPTKSRVINGENLDQTHEKQVVDY